ncbi:MAG: glycosyltransferase [Microgenomates group bacterium]|nr:glycosyltransferase [Microgenomates group bacterium]
MFYFSIVIPTLNEQKRLPNLLICLENQTEKDFEVIISDSNSVDGTRLVAKEFEKKIVNLKFVNSKAKNVSAARNFGASLAKGNYLIFFDADVEFEKNFLEKVKKLTKNNNLDVLTVWNRPKEKKLTFLFILGLLNLSMSIFQNIKPSANGPCIIIKKNLFDRLKGFDESIVFGEDFDLIQRADRLKANFKVFPKPILYVSTRRFEKEGIFLSLYKSIKAIIYQLFLGPIRKPIFEYKMGGQYYENKK